MFLVVIIYCQHLEISSYQITQLKADANNTQLFTKRGKKIVSGYSLEIFNDLCDEESFVRVNRSNLVMVSFIQNSSFEQNKACVNLKNGDLLELP